VGFERDREMKLERKRILFFGAGAIGSLYAGKLALWGHDVTMLARGKRLEELREQGLVLFSEKQGEEKATISLISELKSDDKYDYVFVTLRRDNLHDVLPILGQNQSQSFVCMVNTADGFSEWITYLGAERIIAAFPGANAKIENGSVHYQLTPTLIQPTTVGELNGTESQRLLVLTNMLQEAGFPNAISKNMDSWLKSHLAMICPLAYGIDSGDSFSKNKKAITLMCRALKENFSFLYSSKYGVKPAMLHIYRILPNFLLVRIMRSVFNSTWIETMRKFQTPSAQNEMNLLANDFIRLAEENGVELQFLKEIMNHTKPNHL
jgi:2-dehydropantoate 2-reductase